MVAHLPSMHDVPGSVPSLLKKMCACACACSVQLENIDQTIAFPTNFPFGANLFDFSEPSFSRL